MAASVESNGDRSAFAGKVKEPHKRVDPCFMTGKGCVYTELINNALEERGKTDRCEGFALMPFRQNLKVFFENCLGPFFESNYGDNHAEECSLRLGDQVRRPGVIICEGICKRIQESDYIVADVSVPNPNVFYELGLAYGIGQKIVVLHHQASTFGAQMAQQLKDTGLRAYSYDDLVPIDPNHFKVSNYIWRNEPDAQAPGDQGLGIHLYDLDHDHGAPVNPQRHNAAAGDSSLRFHVVSALNLLLEQAFPGGNPRRAVAEYLARAGTPGDQEDIFLDFRTHVESAVGLAINRIHRSLSGGTGSPKIIESYLQIVEALRTVKTFIPESTFKDIRGQIERCYCLIVRTGGKNCHPMAYFWLGYGHARGKNVIPITIIRNPKDPVEDLAFDIRAQRHTTFVEKQPELLQGEVEGTLRQMIISDFVQWSRKQFWDKMLGRRGDVSIFTGALTNETFNREMIGDWDLRAASELTSYFARHQYRATIENPVYAWERVKKIGKEDYIDQLRGMMKGNCILIASPDVNPLTEIVLGTIYDVNSGEWFSSAEVTRNNPLAMVAVKEVAVTEKRSSEEDATVQSAKRPERAFYKEPPLRRGSKRPRRGFMSRQIPGGEVLKEFVSQSEKPSKFEVYAHLVIVPNPFDVDSPDPHYIIVLNGVSGPATFALTHVLTGGVSEEFVSYKDASFKPEEESEGVLEKMLDKLRGRGNRTGLECVFTVEVGPSAETPEQAVVDTADWRRILSWQLDQRALGLDVIKELTLPQ